MNVFLLLAVVTASPVEEMHQTAEQVWFENQTNRNDDRYIMRYSSRGGWYVGRRSEIDKSDIEVGQLLTERHRWRQNRIDRNMSERNLAARRLSHRWRDYMNHRYRVIENRRIRVWSFHSPIMIGPKPSLDVK